MSSARAPFQASSSPTCGPTNSTRWSLAAGSAADRPSMTDLERSALFCPGLSGMRMSTSRDEPKFWTEKSL